MTSRVRRFAPIVVFSLLATVTCSDDDPTGTVDDTTPPSVSSVSAVDARHIEVVFSEEVTRASAEDAANYSIVTTTRAASTVSAAGGGLSIAAAALGGGNTRVTLSTTSNMLAIGYSIHVQNIADRAGNTMEQGVDRGFTGSTAADNTGPLLVYKKPAAGATGVSPGQMIELTFSEPVQIPTLEAAFGMAGSQGVVDVTFTTSDATHFYGIHDPLSLNTNYDVVVLHTVLDFAGNPLPHTAWSFRTAGTAETTPPVLVSSVPDHLATGVDVNAPLSLTFSEAINPASFTPFFTPEVLGMGAWSPDGKTYTFTPASPLMTDTQYELLILPGDVADLSGNPNTQLFTRVFSTGATLAAGSIAGTIVGDPNSSESNDPTGAFVAAADAFPFGPSPFSVFGVTVVGSNDTYTAQHLRDGEYFPFCIMNTANDGHLEPFLGDAIGFYGIDIATGDMSPDSVVVAGGAGVTGVDFALYDPTSVYGGVSYEGVHSGESHSIFVGLFETAGFDPTTSEPIAGTEVYWPDLPSYVINSLEVGPIAAGSYYVGAYLDVNDSGSYEPAVDPAGLFGGTPPDAIDLTGGKDAPDTDILLLDPVPGMSAASPTQWKTTPHAQWLQNLSRAVRESQVADR